MTPTPSQVDPSAMTPAQPTGDAGREKLSAAQLGRLNDAPDSWGKMPSFGDQRSIDPLKRKGMIEVRERDLTPKDWDRSIATMVDRKWRRTDAGRAALAAAKTGGGQP